MLDGLEPPLPVGVIAEGEASFVLEPAATLEALEPPLPDGVALEAEDTAPEP